MGIGVGLGLSVYTKEPTMTPALRNHPITAQWPPQHPERLQL